MLSDNVDNIADVTVAHGLGRSSREDLNFCGFYANCRVENNCRSRDWKTTVNVARTKDVGVWKTRDRES